MAGFSIERLVHFLSRLCQGVELTVREAPRGRQRGTVRARKDKKQEKITWPTYRNLSVSQGPTWMNKSMVLALQTRLIEPSGPYRARTYGPPIKSLTESLTKPITSKRSFITHASSWVMVYQGVWAPIVAGRTCRNSK
jgi:hypothetical protein